MYFWPYLGNEKSYQRSASVKVTRFYLRFSRVMDFFGFLAISRQWKEQSKIRWCQNDCTYVFFRLHNRLDIHISRQQKELPDFWWLFSYLYKCVGHTSRRAQRMKSRGPKGRQLEDKAPRLLISNNIGISNFENDLKHIQLIGIIVPILKEERI